MRWLAKGLPLTGLMLGLFAMPVLGREAPTHCGDDEVVVFSCQIGKKVASLCATKDIGEDRGQLTYRFGRPGRIEMTYPPVATKPQQAFSYALLGKGDYVRFTNQGVNYIVFSEVRPGRGDVEGVFVTRPGQKPRLLACREWALGPERWMPVYKAKLPRDEEPFDLPR